MWKQTVFLQRSLLDLKDPVCSSLTLHKEEAWRQLYRHPFLLQVSDHHFFLSCCFLYLSDSSGRPSAAWTTQAGVLFPFSFVYVCYYFQRFLSFCQIAFDKSPLKRIIIKKLNRRRLVWTLSLFHQIKVSDNFVSCNLNTNIKDYSYYTLGYKHWFPILAFLEDRSLWKRF